MYGLEIRWQYVAIFNSENEYVCYACDVCVFHCAEHFSLLLVPSIARCERKQMDVSTGFLVQELELLHKEWFPVEYGKQFYDEVRDMRGRREEDVRVMPLGCLVCLPIAYCILSSQNEWMVG